MIRNYERTTSLVRTHTVPFEANGEEPCEVEHKVARASGILVGARRHGHLAPDITQAKRGAEALVDGMRDVPAEELDHCRLRRAEDDIGEPSTMRCNH